MSSKALIQIPCWPPDRFLLTENGLKPVIIRLGIQNGSNVEVLSGLEEGDELVRGPQDLEREGHPAVAGTGLDLLASRAGRESAAGAVFIGDRGKVRVGNNEFTTSPAEIASVPQDQWKIRLPVSNDHLANWIDCIKTRQRPIAAPPDASTCSRAARASSTPVVSSSS